MNTKIPIAIGLVAGFFGGAMFHYTCSPLPVQAQVQAPTEIRAQKFVIVDEHGLPRGAFGINPKDGWPIIEMTGEKEQLRRVRWYPAGWTGKGKPLVVPQQ
jgi:hypothetical protein